MTTEKDTPQTPEPQSGYIPATPEEDRANEERYRQSRQERWQATEPFLEMTPAELAYWEKTIKEKDDDVTRIDRYLEAMYSQTGRHVEKNLSLTFDQGRNLMREIMKAHGFSRENYITKGTNIPEVLNGLIKWALYHADSPYDGIKGPYLYGMVGRGKTEIANFLSAFTKATGFKTFQVVHVKKILLEVSKAKSLGPIDKYLTGSWLFNDIGAEEDDDSFGNRVALMERIIGIRADDKQPTGGTGNCYPEKLPVLYTDRTVSRFYRLFNMIEVKGPHDFSQLKK